MSFENLKKKKKTTTKNKKSQIRLGELMLHEEGRKDARMQFQ